MGKPAPRSSNASDCRQDPGVGQRRRRLLTRRRPAPSAKETPDVTRPALRIEGQAGQAATGAGKVRAIHGGLRGGSCGAPSGATQRRHVAALEPPMPIGMLGTRIGHRVNKAPDEASSRPFHANCGIVIKIEPVCRRIGGEIGRLAPALVRADELATANSAPGSDAAGGFRRGTARRRRRAGSAMGAHGSQGPCGADPARPSAKVKARSLVGLPGASRNPMTSSPGKAGALP